MKLVFACGGSGGHIFPAVAVAEELERRVPGLSVLFISGERDIENEIFRTLDGRRVKAMPGARGLPGLVRSTGAARAFLREEKPDAVVGFGGYGSVPVVLAARWARIPTLIHEQNVLPGLANRVLAGFSDGVALSFEETRPRPKGRKVRVTGNPIRRAIERECRAEALGFFGFSAGKRTLLVLGGSQGAESVNTLMLDAVSKLSAETKRAVQVLHLCGRMKPVESEKRFAAEGIASRAFSFFERMDLAYGAADLVVGRAGATFLAEMEARRLPAVLIPYPYAGGHQSANAQVVARRTNATVAEQKDLNGEKLAALIEKKLGEGRGVKGKGETGTPSPFTLHPSPDGNARALLADFILEIAQS